MLIKADIKQISCGSSNSFALKRNGDLLCFGELKNTKDTIHEKVALLGMVDSENPVHWSFQEHFLFDDDIQKQVYSFLLCLKRVVPKHLMLPKPIFSIVINFSI